MALKTLLLRKKLSEKQNLLAGMEEQRSAFAKREEELAQAIVETGYYQQMKDLEERDRIRNFQPPITGDIIMREYDVPPCSLLGEIKEIIKNAILDGEIPNDYDAAHALMEKLAEQRGLVKREL